MVKRKRNKGDCRHFTPDPGLQRFARNVSDAFVHIAEALDKEAFGDSHRSPGNSDQRLHRHKFRNHQTVGAMGAVGAFRTSPPPRWSSEELLVKALGAESELSRNEAISALKRLGLKLWERDGAVIIA